MNSVRFTRLAISLSVAALGLPTAAARAQQPSVSAELSPRITIGIPRDPALAAALGDVSAARIRQTDSALVSFGTRHTMSDTLSPTRGIGAARRYLYAKLTEYSRQCGGCLRVEYDGELMQVTGHPQKPMVNMVDVLAILPGRDTSRVIVMGGHYDSCICGSMTGGGGSPLARYNSTDDAPGADDDGSGSSAVVELARVFSKHFPKGLDATIIFALYTGEELGLYGSTHLAQRLHKQGYHVTAAFTDDIVGNVTADDGRVDSTSVRVFGENPDFSLSRELARYAWAAGAIYTPRFKVLPVFRLDRVGRGGDHSPFVNLGDPGLRFTERLENYKRQHLPTDDFAHVSFSYVANVARLNGAVVGSLAAAPPIPSDVSTNRDGPSGGQYWKINWSPVPGAVGYEILYRHTFVPTWESIVPVGNVSSYLLKEQLDDGWAAVRSVSADGHRSLAVSVPPMCAPAPRARAAGDSAARPIPVRRDSSVPRIRRDCVRLPGQ
jgi:hypothetical protein